MGTQKLLFILPGLSPASFQVCGMTDGKVKQSKVVHGIWELFPYYSFDQLQQDAEMISKAY